ncbi:malto-oligosyltrehalose trehalohydrolase [Parvularcula dongshanensis]|uniref:Malto-oligosyltrehalose trehalohydrolase n=1 Tax=Parvularcula dongshanensis TaxID=1173995 RepID=A0A840I409_9PROT|nr:malto-oligosyltrehalose trehalohydrolase [Parvularcula dongshanensis]MBB4659062.1 malto-oligosyltrehalose trehalohydrolase [Parvularcula dongshanensis]
MSLGPIPHGVTLEEGGARFRLWAPNADAVALLYQGRSVDMAAAQEGWREAFVEGAKAGDTYQYQVGDLRVPDPASRGQKDDVHGPSLIVDPGAYEWRHTEWRGRPWEDTVIEEVHVGAATPEGTFDGLRRKLSHYKELGVTAIEILPVASFAGARNWGYDGVLQFAPDTSYGTPDDLRRLIDEAHGLGLQMLIDVVYNHFGPDGNYLGAYAQDFFDQEKHTPWGAALNFGRAPVREFFIQNAVMWLTEYRFDGIRFDAVQAISGMAAAEGRGHFLEEMAEAIRERTKGRHVHLILENDDNTSELLVRKDGEAVFYDGQWNDDFHHVVHRMITGETDGYYADYPAPGERLAKVLREGFDYQGQPSHHRGDKARGTPSGGLPTTAFVNFIQNHDQVGNRALGDRIDEAAPEEAVVAATALYLLGPQIPMIWMGEEWASSSTFPFFCDFHGELAEAVRNGRREEFGRFEAFRDPAAREVIPDPNAQETFLAAKLDWQEMGRHRHADRIALFKELLALRHEHVVPLLKSGGQGAEAENEGDTVLARYRFGEGTLTICANLSPEGGGVHGDMPGEVIFSTHDALVPSAMPPWSLTASIAR